MLKASSVCEGPVLKASGGCERACVGGGESDMATKSKARRKISLPWFRQSSFVANFPLFRQHTIDTPRGFRGQVREPQDGRRRRGSDRAGGRNLRWV